MSALVDKSLLQQKEHGSRDLRFVMLESIREYAFERLTENEEEADTRLAHAAYALVVAEELQAHSRPPETSEWVKQCDAEHDNLRAALDWLVETDHGEWALRLGAALFQFWEAREHLAEGRRLLQRILNMKSTAPATSVRARVSFYAGAFTASQRDYDEAFTLFDDARRLYAELHDDKGVAAMVTALGTNRRLRGDLNAGRAWLEQGLNMYRGLQDRPGIASLASNLADVLSAQGDGASARTLMQEALGIFRELGDSSGVGWSFNRLGDIAFHDGDLKEAQRLYEEGAAVFRMIEDQWGMARSYADLGFLACQQVQLQRARLLFVQALETLQTLGHTRGMARVFEGLACLAIETQSPERALTLAGAAAGLREALGSASRPEEELTLQRKLQAAWENLDAAQARALWTLGSSMPLEEAIRYALESPGGRIRIVAT
jgi:tetratricopeptide (TPR) repeat protein